MNVKQLYICLIFLLFCTFGHAYVHQLSICAIFQDEAPYLNEWIEYHHKKGVEHFYLYNNNSKDNYEDVLQPWIKKSIVELIEWPSEEKGGNYFFYTIQCGAYNDALKRCKESSKWLAIIDSDEFIVPKMDKKIIDCLERVYFGCCGVCVNWQCFGTSHIQKLDPLKKSYEQLLMKMKWNDDWNTHFKSIVRPKYVTVCPNPHLCFYTPPFFHVNTHKERVDMRSPVYIDILQLNHYWTRDEDYLHNVKLPRYIKWNGNGGGILEHGSKMNEEYDDSILSNPCS